MEKVLLKEEVPRDGATSGVDIDRRKRHRKGNKKEGRTKKPKGGEVVEEELPGAGATRGVGIDRRKRDRQGNKKERRTKKPKGGEVVEEEVPGDGATSGVCIDRRKRHRKGNKEGRTKKPKGGEVGDEAVNPEGDEAVKPRDDELVKPKGGEAMEEMTRKKGRKTRKTKLVTWRLSNELIGYLHTKEVMGFIATDTPRPLLPHITGELFDTELKEEIVSVFKEDREFDAYILYQYRTKGYAEIQEVVSEDDEEVEALDHPLVFAW